MILLIDNYDSFVYNLYQFLAIDHEQVVVVRNDKITLAEIEKLAPQGIVMSPGPGHPKDAGICIPLIQTFSGEIPLLGVCLGHQAIGMAFGAKIERAAEILHGKSSPVFHYRQQLYQAMPLPFTAGRYHSLIVAQEDFPSELMIEAQTADNVIMGLRHREHLTFGVQFHPESILTPQGNILLKAFTQVCESHVKSLS